MGAAEGPGPPAKGGAASTALVLPRRHGAPGGFVVVETHQDTKQKIQKVNILYKAPAEAGHTKPQQTRESPKDYTKSQTIQAKPRDVQQE